jgi:hypothetical protein
MSYQTVEVDLENGRVRPRGSESLPAKARALLTIVESVKTPSANAARTMGQALRELNVIGRGEYTDLSTNKAHLDDLGR